MKHLTTDQIRTLATVNRFGTVSVSAGIYRIAVTGKRQFDRVKAVYEACGMTVANTREDRYPQLMKLSHPSISETDGSTESIS